jgi:hypothetical protein
LLIAAVECVDRLLGRAYRRSVARVAGAQDQAIHLVWVQHREGLGNHAAQPSMVPP